MLILVDGKSLLFLSCFACSVDLLIATAACFSDHKTFPVYGRDVSICQITLAVLSSLVWILEQLDKLGKKIASGIWGGIVLFLL